MIKNIKKIHTTSEVLLKQWYDKIKKVFNIIPCGHYGQMEKVSFMHQVESSRDMKQNLEYGVNEFYDNEDGTYGLIATGFILQTVRGFLRILLVREFGLD